MYRYGMGISDPNNPCLAICLCCTFTQRKAAQWKKTLKKVKNLDLLGISLLKNR